MIPLNCMGNARVHSNGQPKEPKKSEGIKWALIASITILAAAILSAGAFATAAVGIVGIVSGIAAPAAIIQLCSAIFLGLAAAQLVLTSIQCIKNAHYHLKPPKGHRLGSAAGLD